MQQKVFQYKRLAGALQANAFAFMSMTMMMMMMMSLGRWRIECYFKHLGGLSQVGRTASQL